MLEYIALVMIQIRGVLRTFQSRDHMLHDSRSQLISQCFETIQRQVLCIFRWLFSSGVNLAFDQASKIIASDDKASPWCVSQRDWQRYEAFRSSKNVIRSSRNRAARKSIERIRGSRYASAINIYSHRSYRHATEIFRSSIFIGCIRAPSNEYRKLWWVAMIYNCPKRVARAINVASVVQNNE